MPALERLRVRLRAGFRRSAPSQRVTARLGLTIGMSGTSSTKPVRRPYPPAAFTPPCWCPTVSAITFLTRHNANVRAPPWSRRFVGSGLEPDSRQGNRTAASPALSLRHERSPALTTSLEGRGFVVRGMRAPTLRRVRLHAAAAGVAWYTQPALCGWEGVPQPPRSGGASSLEGRPLGEAFTDRCIASNERGDEHGTDGASIACTTTCQRRKSQLRMQHAPLSGADSRFRNGPPSGGVASSVSERRSGGPKHCGRRRDLSTTLTAAWAVSCRAV